LAGGSHGSETSVPFAVKCSAGHLVQGQRQRRHQVVRCTECGVDVFVLPRSPFPSLDDSRARRNVIPVSPWRRPFVAAGFTLLLVAGATVALLIVLNRKTGVAGDLEAHRSAAEEALQAGRLRRAAEEFARAREVALHWPDALAPAELRSLTQQFRETNLLADLLSESLDEILLRAARSHEDEWSAQFTKRYHGPGQANAVVFDAKVRRIGEGRYDIDWELMAGNEPARLVIDELRILHELPLQEPRRLVFGARLGSIQREQNGVWTVRFEPASGVLLTDPRAVAACWPHPVDEELRTLLDQQRKWADGK
jgi:hypothetical protein